MAFSSRLPSQVSLSFRFCFVKSILDNKSTILYIPKQVDCRVAKYNEMFPFRSRYETVTSKQRKLPTGNSIALLSDLVYPNGLFSSCAKLINCTDRHQDRMSLSFQYLDSVTLLILENTGATPNKQYLLRYSK